MITQVAGATILPVEAREIRALLSDLRSGRVSLEDSVGRLRALPFRKAGEALVDTHRAIRCGFPEVVYCQGKSPAQLKAIARAIREAGQSLLATRADLGACLAIRRVFPRAAYHREARLVTARAHGRLNPPCGNVAVVTAGSADRSVAEEAAVTAEFLGSAVRRLYDVGVAGLHRLLARLPELQGSRVVVVVAGMEGALPSVVGGLVACPVIAVPTSVGYGTHLEGVTPLLSMMSSCAPNVAVVNIDNGFGAGYIAALINRMGIEETR